MAQAAGFKLLPIPVSWLTRDLLVFATSIGIEKDELQFLYVSTALPISHGHRGNS